LPNGAAPPPRSPPPRSPPPAPPAREVTSSFSVLGIAPEDFGAAQQAAFCAELLSRLGLTGGATSCAVTSVAPLGDAGRRRLAQSGSDVTFTLTFEVGSGADAAIVAEVEALVRQVLVTLGDRTIATAAIEAAVAAAFPGLAVSVEFAGGPPPETPSASPTPAPATVPVPVYPTPVPTRSTSPLPGPSPSPSPSPSPKVSPSPSPSPKVSPSPSPSPSLSPSP
jgi:hypothetical protein